MSYSLEIDHGLKIVRYVHSGRMELKEIGDAWREMLGMNEFIKEKYNIFTDYRNGYLGFSLEELDRVDEFLFSIKDVLNGKKNAVLTNRADDHAIVMLVGNKKQKAMNYHVKMFTDEDSALTFLRS